MFKLKSKPITLIVLFICIILSVAVFVFIKASKFNSPPSGPPPTLPPGITNPNASVSYHIQVPETINTTSLPIYNLSYPSPETVKQTLSNSFKLDKPTEISINNFHKFVWTSGQISLSFNPDTHAVAYLNSDILKPSTSVSDALVANATAFVQSILNLPSHITITPIKTTYLATNGTAAKAVLDPHNADLLEAEYRFLINGIPLYLPPYEQADTVVDLNIDGVRNVKTKLPPNLNPTQTNITIINQTQAEQQLTSGHGIILKVNNAKYSETGPQFSVSEISIQAVSLGYVIHAESIIPAYVFQGSAPNRQSPSTKYSVEVAVSAAPTP